MQSKVRDWNSVVDGKYVTSVHVKGLLSHSFNAMPYSWEEHFKLEEAIKLTAAPNAKW